MDPLSVDFSKASCDTHGNGVRVAQPPLKNSGSGLRGRFDLPTDCRRIVIVGAGGFGRELLQWVRDSWPEQASLVAGFLSDDPSRLGNYSVGVGILSTIVDYEPQPGDYLLLGIGVPYARRRVAEQLLARGGKFLTLVHPRAMVAATASISEGAVLCPFVIVSDSAKIGRFVLANYHASVGHDAFAGEFTVLSPYATLGGNARVEDDVFLGLHASVGPGRSLGSRSKVSANSCVLANAPAGSLVFGVPGRVSVLVSPNYG